jgi:apolipoprotein D and lipocalin family protein
MKSVKQIRPLKKTWNILILLILINPVMAQRPFIRNFDLSRYLGRWYEIARFNHSFEKGLVGVTANYTLLPDGMIRVENAGHKGTLEGVTKTAIGKAKSAGVTTEGHLKVSFFLFFYADYFIMDLDPDYRWALIGSKSDKFLWILSRTPQLEKSVQGRIMDKARSLGYDLSQLYMVPQYQN